MKIWIITMEDPLYTLDFIKDIIRQRSSDIFGLTIAKGGRLKIGKKRSKTAYLFSLLLIMGPLIFFKNTALTVRFKIRKKLASSIPGLKSPGLESYAKKYGIPVDNISNPHDPDFLKKLRNAAPDVIINQSQFIIRKELLEIPRIGVLNRHNALLPKNRGRLTPFWVMFKGEKETGVSIHFVDDGIDSGPIVVQKRFEVTKNDNFNSIVRKNYKIASDAMLEALDLLEKGKINFLPNDDSLANYNTIPDLKDAWRYRLKMGLK